LDDSVSPVQREETTSILQALMVGNISLTPEATERRRQVEAALLRSCNSPPTKEKLLKLLFLLDLPVTDATKTFPMEGFSKTVFVDRSTRIYCQAFLLHNTLVQAVEELLRPEDPSFWETAYHPSNVKRANRL
jgi:hypothetical protein